MNFNAIVGNPPYQDKNGSGGTNDAPLYQDFAQIGIDFSLDYSCMIIKAIWYAGGRKELIDSFRNRMLNCGNIQKLVTINNSGSVFKETQIEGGLCYYLYNPHYNGSCDYTLIQNEESIHDSCRNLNEFKILIKDPRLSALVAKVSKINNVEGNGTVDSIMSADTPFGIPTNPKESKKHPFDVSKTKDDNYNVDLYYIENKVRCIEYVKKTDIRKNANDIDSPKVFIPKARGSSGDSLNVILGQPIIARQGSVCSQTFIYTKFGTMDECKNFVSYLKTRFFRFLVSAAKISQDALNSAYQFVPLQDFSEPWTDEKLYKKYDLTQDEIAYIESLIKPME